MSRKNVCKEGYIYANSANVAIIIVNTCVCAPGIFMY